LIAPLDALEQIPNSSDFAYNETEARSLGLERVEIKGNAGAQQLIEQVISGTIDIETDAGKQKFVQDWQSQCPDIPMPCVLKNTGDVIVQKLADADLSNSDFWYLTSLKKRKIIKNLEGSDQPAMPHFDKDMVLLVDSWQETNWEDPDAATKLISPLLKELLGKESTVKIRREDLDTALWVGDPVSHIPTEKHTLLLKKLGVDPSQFHFRCIAQDEYARLAPTKAWGQKALWTNFNNYYLKDNGVRKGLFGGGHGTGGPSNVGDDPLGDAYGGLAVRLVLVCNK
ncbi:MAG: hypothetical protein HY981_01890, partial [Candidatus Magasanikbacteria bacterium]|nr:hypothetical protein [Candidatus Magasanikbacteria bacterium]